MRFIEVDQVGTLDGLLPLVFDLLAWSEGSAGWGEAICPSGVECLPVCG